MAKENPVSGYKGYEIVQNTTRVFAGKFTHVTYSIVKAGTEVYREMLTGPFSGEEASTAIESAAREWIDRHATVETR